MNLTLMVPAEATDADLVRAHQDGDLDAFAEIARRYLPRLTSFLRGRVGDPSTAEDLAQETVVKALGAIERFDTQRPLWPWLRTIASNAAIDASRARGRSAALTRALQAEVVIDVENPDVAEIELLRHALSDVPERQRAALELCYVEGWRPVDAAASFGVGNNAFEQLLHRARRSLRAAYMRRDGSERAAAVAWLLLVLRPVVAAGARLRSPSILSGRAAEVGIAAATAGILAVALPMADAPAPRAQAPIVQPADVETGQVPDAAPSAVVIDQAGPADPPVAAGDGAEAASVLTPSFAARPAPVATPAPDSTTDAPPVDIPDLDQSGADDPARDDPTPVDPGSAAPGPGRDPSPAEVFGGCGSSVREIVCTVTE